MMTAGQRSSNGRDGVSQVSEEAGRIQIWLREEQCQTHRVEAGRLEVEGGGMGDEGREGRITGRDGDVRDTARW